MMAITLKSARVNAGLTIDEASKRLGISALTLRKWENGDTYPTVASVMDILSLYKLEFNDINFLPKITV